jgi:hypothetical protein
VVGGFAIEACADVFDAKDVDEEGRKLKNAFLNVADVVMEGRVIKKGSIVIPDEPNAAGRRRHDVVSAGKIFQEFCTDVAGFIPEPGVKGRLATAGLVAVVLHFHACLLQHTDHIEGGLGVELVHKTWYEELDRH